MKEAPSYPVPLSWSQNSWCDKGQYHEMYKKSIEDPIAFWDEQATRIDWIKPWNKTKETRFQGEVSIKWFIDGKLNASVNCLDRHLKTKGDQTAIIWEGDDPSETKSISYREALEEVCRFGNVLRSSAL